LLAWFRSLNKGERLTILACFLGWALDAMDTQVASLVTPSIMTAFNVAKSDIGLLATAALLASGLGGWLAGAASDRFGRIAVLQVTIAWFSIGSLLCGLAQDFPQLVAARIFQGIGFGGEWAVGAVLIAEISRPQYRGIAVGVVQSGYSFGLAAASGLYFAAYALLPEGAAWRAMFFVGIAPCLLILFIRASLKEPTHATRALASPQTSAIGGSLIEVFRSPYLGATLLGSSLCTAIQGASAGVGIWLPTMLRTDKGLSVGALSSFFLLLSAGAFLGYLAAAVVADKWGRRASLGTFTTGSMVLVGIVCFAPLSEQAYLAIAAPLGFFTLGVYSNFGPVLSEMYPARVRGSGQGFCYNFGRGMGAIFPAIVGLTSTTYSLSLAMGVMALFAYALACIVIIILPETRGSIID
jgi:MFS family permease